MTNQTDQAYFEWLISQITIPNGKTYNELFERMHKMEFVWTVPNDDNRIRDGIDLRFIFLNNTHKALSLETVTLLEVLIGLSKRVAFTAGGNPPAWAWKLIKNLRLNKATDPLIGVKANRVEEIIYALIWRTYEKNGQGGFFPLSYPTEDQTKVEIWYQMNAYVNEMNDL